MCEADDGMRGPRWATAPVLVDEEEEEAPVVSEQHEVPYHPHHGAQVPEGVPHGVQLQLELPPQVRVQHPRQPPFHTTDD